MKNKKKSSRYSVKLVKDTIVPDNSKFRIFDYGDFIGWLRLDGSVWNISNNIPLNVSSKETFKIRNAAIYTQNTRTILHFWANHGL